MPADVKDVSLSNDVGDTVSVGVAAVVVDANTDVNSIIIKQSIEVVLIYLGYTVLRKTNRLITSKQMLLYCLISPRLLKHHLTNSKHIFSVACFHVNVACCCAHKYTRRTEIMTQLQPNNISRAKRSVESYQRWSGWNTLS